MILHCVRFLLGWHRSLAKLTETGLLVNTTHGTAGANGSFIVNPDYANFDSRGINAGKELDAMEEVIEDVITRHCYEGKPYDREVKYGFQTLIAL